MENALYEYSSVEMYSVPARGVLKEGVDTVVNSIQNIHPVKGVASHLTI